MLRHRVFGDYVFSFANYIILVLIGIVTIFPFLNLLAISFNAPLDTLRGGIYLWPRIFSLFNYHYVFGNGSLFLATVMSVLRTVSGTVLGVLATAMVAFALSRREFMFRKHFNYTLVMTLYINGGLIPSYLLIKNIGLMNTFWVYIIPGLISAYNIILMRSYFDQLPEGVVESTKIDGANEFQTLFYIIIPISMPVVATITLFVGVGHWNSWFDNYLYNGRNTHLNVLQYELVKILLNTVAQSAAVALSNYQQSQIANASPQSIRAALTIIVTLPILCVYPFLQKYFVKGITLAAIKE